MRGMFSRLPELCRAQPEVIARWLDETEWKWMAYCALTILLGAGLYGATIGLWRGGLMAAYVSIKFPLLIFLTTVCNTGINTLLALVMGSGIGFRQTLLVQLMSYTVAALILAAMAPITLFILLNTPPLESGNRMGHGLFLLLNVGIIAVTGLLANISLYSFLLARTARRGMARRILFAWVAGNLFVGAQLSWNLRPFIGSPHLEIQFLRPNPFDGNFYETVVQAAMRLGEK